MTINSDWDVTCKRKKKKKEYVHCDFVLPVITCLPYYNVVMVITAV